MERVSLIHCCLVASCVEHWTMSCSCDALRCTGKTVLYIPELRLANHTYLWPCLWVVKPKQSSQFANHLWLGLALNLLQLIQSLWFEMRFATWYRRIRHSCVWFARASINFWVGYCPDKECHICEKGVPSPWGACDASHWCVRVPLHLASSNTPTLLDNSASSVRSPLCVEGTGGACCHSHLSPQSLRYKENPLTWCCSQQGGWVKHLSIHCGGSIRDHCSRMLWFQ